LHKIFSSFGQIQQTSFEKDSNYSNSVCGFITYASPLALKKLQKAMNKFYVVGQRVYITPARPIKEKIYVSGYDNVTTEAELRNIFSKFGEIDNIEMQYDSDQISRGFGFITFINSEQAVKYLCFKRFVPCRDEILEVKKIIAPGNSDKILLTTKGEAKPIIPKHLPLVNPYTIYANSPNQTQSFNSFADKNPSIPNVTFPIIVPAPLHSRATFDAVRHRSTLPNNVSVTYQNAGASVYSKKKFCTISSRPRVHSLPRGEQSMMNF